MKTTLDSIGTVKLYQHADGYRFSLDPVLLSAFVSSRAPGRIADLGSGTGVAGLLLARRYPGARVTLIELQRALHALAIRNVALNRLKSRATPVNADLRTLPKGFRGAFDLVVSNPPFRQSGAGRLSRGAERAIARHELKMTLKDLVASAAALLGPRGRFCVVYHPSRLLELVDELRAVRLEPKRIRFVHGRAGAEAKMFMLEARSTARPGLKVLSPLFVYGPDGRYTVQAARAMGA